MRILKSSLPAIALICITWIQSSAPVCAEVIVMTQNVLHGANLNPVISAIASGDPTAIQNAATAAYQEALDSNYAVRADAIAAQIQASGAHLVGLQEVAVFDSLGGSGADLDYLSELTTALSNRGLSYSAVAISTNADEIVPTVIGGTPDGLRFTNSNVILARTDLNPSLFSVSNPLNDGIFDDPGSVISLGTVDLESGYAAVDVQFDGTSFRFINTHLESISSPVNIAQGNELLSDVVAVSPLPVVVVGDLNSSAPSGTTYTNMINSGLVDAWTAVNPGQPGYTFGTGIFEPTPSFTTRIDYVLTSSVLDINSAEVVGEEPSDRVEPPGIWPSDHAGVVVAIATVPEPSSFAIAGLATIGFVVRRRRRQQRQTHDTVA